MVMVRLRNWLPLVIGWMSLGHLPAAIAQMPSFFRSNHGIVGDTYPLPDNLNDDARLVWQTELLPGNSTPCVYGDAIYVTTFDAERRELATVALDRGSGRLRWKQVAPAETIERYHPVGSPASSTPACDGERVFVFFGSYGLLCYDLDGRLLWSKRMGPFQDEFGASSSPILVDDLVILNEDHDVGSFLIAIDKRTGETAWETSREGFVRSYSTPVVLDIDGRRQIVVAGSLQMTGYDAGTGERIWWVDGLSRIVDCTPCVVGDRIFIATWTPGGDETNRIRMEPFADALQRFDRNGDGKIGEDELPEGEILSRFFRMDLNQDKALDGDEWAKHARVFELAQNAAMAVRPSGTGDVTQQAVLWKYRRSLPTVPSSVVYDGVLYMVKDSGIVTSLDADTGTPLKQGRAAGPGNYYASLVAGDGKVFLCSERGVLTILQAGREWQILSSHDFGRRIMATPVVDQGELFIRTEQALMKFVKR